MSGEQLRATVTDLSRDYPAIPMTGVVGDFSAEAFAFDPGCSRNVAYFPGSTIGNLEPDEAKRFLVAWRPRLTGGGMLVGVDLVKDPKILHDAYNDHAGVTAAFNRNILARLNRDWRIEGYLSGDASLARRVLYQVRRVLARLLGPQETFNSVVVQLVNTLAPILSSL